LAHRSISNYRDPHLRSADLFSGETFRFQVSVERKLVTVKFGNRVTAEEVGAYVEKLLAHPLFRSTFSEIADIREAEEIELQADDFLKLADQVDPFSPEAKRAFVVTTTVQNHAAPMHKILRSQRNIEIFQTFEEAERWIGS
jgi:hypothetical protein